MAAGISTADGVRAADTLKITSVEAFPVKMWKGFDPSTSVAFESDVDPRRWRYRGPFAQLTSSILVVIKTKQGITGYGLGAGGKVSCQIIEGHLQHLLLGTNPLNVEMLWNQMYSSGLFYGRRGVFVMALSGVDNALWDILGKYSEQPVHHLLGGTIQDSIPVYQTTNTAGIDAALRRGVEHFKVVVADGVDQGERGKRRTEKALTGTREIIGPNKSLMIECITRWNDVEYAIDMARKLEALDLYWIEEPLSPDDLEGYARLVREVGSTRIACGEHEYTQFGFAELIRHKAADVLQPDVSWCGGVTALIKIESQARAANLEFTPHRGGSVFGLPLCLTSNQCNWAESFGDESRSTELMMAMSSEVRGGHCFPSHEPGFGVSLDEKLIKAHILG